jgi:hypothetical protein
MVCMDAMLICYAYVEFFSSIELSKYTCCCSHKIILSRMASEMRGQAGGNPPPPPEPSMEKLLRLMLEDRKAARAERQANLATL